MANGSTTDKVKQAPSPKGNKGRPKPLSQFASFVTSHRREKTEPILELNHLSNIVENTTPSYEPDTEALLNAIRARLINFPSQDLPARYASVLLRLFERLESFAWENSRLGLFQSGNSRTDLEIETPTNRLPVKQYIRSYCEFCACSNCQEQRLGGNPIQRPKPQTDRSVTRSSSYQQFEEGDYHDCHTEAAAIPTRQDTVLTRIPLEPPRPLFRLQSKDSRTDSDLSNFGGDLLPDEEIPLQEKPHVNEDLVLRLTKWFTERTGDESEAVMHEITDIISQEGSAKAKTTPVQPLARRVTSLLSPALPVSEQAARNENTPLDPDRERNRERRFSFVPGDDAQQAHIMPLARTRMQDLEVGPIEANPEGEPRVGGSDGKDKSRGPESHKAKDSAFRGIRVVSPASSLHSSVATNDSTDTKKAKSNEPSSKYCHIAAAAAVAKFSKDLTPAGR